jgi:hypothetical protein
MNVFDLKLNISLNNFKPSPIFSLKKLNLIGSPDPKDAWILLLFGQYEAFGIP